MAVQSIVTNQNQLPEILGPGVGAVAFYTFDDAGGGIARDQQGVHDGAIIGATPVPGRTGGALQFDGAQYVDVPDSPDWTFGSDDFSIVLWANFSSEPSGSVGAPEGGVLLAHDEGRGETNKWWLAAYSGNLGVHVNSPTLGPQFFAETPFNPVLGEWYFIGLTKSGSSYQLYVNDQLGGSATQTFEIPDANAPLTMGQGEGFYFNGKIDGVGIYHHALSQDELLGIYQSGAGVPGDASAVSITENTTAVTTVTATDPDDGQTLTYSIAGGADAVLFTIDANTGALTFATAPNFEAPTDAGSDNIYDVTVQVSDGNGGTDTQAIAVTVGNVNEAPILDLNGADNGRDATLNYTEQQAATPIAPSAIVSDIDSADFSGGSLRVAQTFSAGTDRLTIGNIGAGADQISVSGGVVSYQGVEIGTVSGGTGGNDLVVNFTSSSATPAAVQALVRDIQYENGQGDNPSGVPRTFTYTLNDGGGTGSVSAVATVNVARINDPPVVTAGNMLGYTENGAAIAISPAATVTDPDVIWFVGGSLTVHFSANGTVADQLTIGNVGAGAGQIGVSGNTVSYQGVAFGTFSGGVNGADLVVNFFTNTAPTPAAVQALVQNIRFSNTSDNPSTATRTVTFTLDDGGNTGGPPDLTGSDTATINLTAINDAPMATPVILADGTEDTVYTISAATLLSGVNDVDGPSLSVTSVTVNSGGGSITDNQDGSWTYAPAANYSGPITFDYTATDGLLSSSSTATLNLAASTNQPPVIASNGGNDTASVSVAENTTLVTTLAATDPNAGDTLTFSIGGGEDAALFELRNGNQVHFRTAPDFEALPPEGGAPGYQVEVRVSDGNGGTDAQAIAVTVQNAAGISQTGNGSANTLTGAAEEDTLNGAGGNDTLRGLAGNDVLIGGAGADLLDGGAGRDTMTGGAGNDTYEVDSLQDVVVENSGEGTDTIRTALAAFSLAAVANVENLTFIGTGNFAGTGNALANTITGGAGNDTLDGSTGADRLVGLGGNDTYNVGHQSDIVVEAANAGTDTVVATSAAYNLSANIENLIYAGTGTFNGDGNGLANTITGGSNADTLSGAGGNDTLIGLGGNDALGGGAGDDTFVARAGDGNDGYVGNGGNDTYSLAGLSAGTAINLAAGTATGSEIGSDSLSSIENVVGGSGQDVITASNAQNLFAGGIGNDAFIFVNTAAAGMGSNRDQISDFAASADRIDVSGIDANGNQAGNPAFVFAGEIASVINGVGQLGRGQLGYHYETDTNGVAHTIVEGSIDADAAAEFQIDLVGRYTLSAGDFVL